MSCTDVAVLLNSENDNRDTKLSADTASSINATQSSIIKYFDHSHLPEHLKAISKPLCQLAEFMDQQLPNGAEKTTGLRKLLEAKDCFVREAVGMPNKLKNLVSGEISDGYHTFNELYAHRMQLFAYICHANQSRAWKSKHHHPEDGPMYPDYFVVGLNTPEGQFSYHYHLDHWNFFSDVSELDHAPKFDGHTSNHVFRIHSLNTNQTFKYESDNHMKLQARECIEIDKPIIGDTAQFQFQPNLTVKTDENGIASLESKAIPSGAFMSFGEALEALKQGYKLARSGWNGKDQYVVAQALTTTTEASKIWNIHNKAHAEKLGGYIDVAPYFTLKTAQNTLAMGWIPSTSDLFANDWVVVA